ncbi:hypothetical protein YT1_1110 [Rhodococcus ruber]|nr:hypothetical protein YT1_1110 [Rhodococcus ruber]
MSAPGTDCESRIVAVRGGARPSVARIHPSRTSWIRSPAPARTQQATIAYTVVAGGQFHLQPPPRDHTRTT